MKKVLKITIILLGVIIVALGVMHVLHSKHGRHGQHHGDHPALIPAEGLPTIPPFTFTNQLGNAFGTGNLKGKIWVANFIFTRCQGPCPIMSHRMSQLIKEYKESKNLSFVSFSVDPDYDTPPVLKTYSEKYHADPNQWSFLTAPRQVMYDFIQNKFKLTVKDSDFIESDPNEMQILHSLHFVLVDQNRSVQGYYNSNDPESLNELKIKLNHMLSNS